MEEIVYARVTKLNFGTRWFLKFKSKVNPTETRRSFSTMLRIIPACK